MKRVLTCLIFLWLFYYFLVYAGFFRNNTDPVEVAKFYFECMKDYEWMLTYPVTKPGYFDPAAIINNKEKIFDRIKIENMEFKLLGTKGRTAFVEAKLMSRDQHEIRSTATLEKNIQNQWLIINVNYN